MPYEFEKVKGGVFVVGPSGRKSKKPLTMEKAKKQRIALNIAKAQGHVMPMPVSEFRAEHKRLVRTLEEGTKAKRMAEAARQRAEVMERIG